MLIGVSGENTTQKRPMATSHILEDPALSRIRAEARLQYPAVEAALRPVLVAKVGRMLQESCDATPGDFVSGPTATQAFERVSNTLAARATKLLQYYSSGDWLFILRSLPFEVWKGGLRREGSWANYQQLAEFLTSTIRGLDLTPATQTFPMELSLRYVVHSCVVANARVFHRLAAKGATFRLAENDFPEVVDDDVSRAIKLHDDRMDADAGIDRRTGTRAMSSFDGVRKVNTVMIAAQRFSLGGPSSAASYSALGGREVSEWSYDLSLADLRFPEFMRIAGSGSTWLSSELLMQRAVSNIVVNETSLWLDALRLGQTRFSTRRLAQELFRIIESEFYEELKCSLGIGLHSENATPQQVARDCATPIWGKLSMTPPSLRDATSSNVRFDYASSFRRINNFQMPSVGAGKLSHERSKDFEICVQELIDNSTWLPPTRMRDLVGRTLKRPDESHITDIDCIGYRNGTALLIDAKSYTRPSEVEGDFLPTRNVRTALESEHRSWIDKVREIESCPVGPNYDLSSVSRFLPLIVTVAPHFVHLPLSEPRVINDLRPVSSVAELEAFLRDS